MGILSRLRDHDDQDSCGGMWASGRWAAETAREVSSTTVDMDRRKGFSREFGQR